MRAAVVGAGAMGSIFGARLASGGVETVLVDVAQPLVDKINADGVTVVRGDEETTTRVPATSDPASAGVADLVVFFVKCYHTASAAEMARPLVGPDTVVASLQNGWGNGDVLASVYDPQQVVVGVTYNSGTVLGLGKVAHPGVGPTYMGPFASGSLDGAERLAGALSTGDLEAHVAGEIRPEIWKKLILNAATLPTAALTGMNAGALTAHAEMRELVGRDRRARVLAQERVDQDAVRRPDDLEARRAEVRQPGAHAPRPRIASQPLTSATKARFSCAGVPVSSAALTTAPLITSTSVRLPASKSWSIDAFVGPARSRRAWM